MSEENTNPEISETEILQRYKRAHLSGWLTQQIVGGGATHEEAQKSFVANDAVANKTLEKYAKIRETILAQN
jgi:hypothetical protein